MHLWLLLLSDDLIKVSQVENMTLLFSQSTAVMTYVASATGLPFSLKVALFKAHFKWFIVIGKDFLWGKVQFQLPATKELLSTECKSFPGRQQKKYKCNLPVWLFLLPWFREVLERLCILLPSVIVILWWYKIKSSYVMWLQKVGKISFFSTLVMETIVIVM